MPGQTLIAVIGLGSMGLGMARSLIRAGHSVAGCDISEQARESFEASGGKPPPPPLPSKVLTSSSWSW